MSIELYREAFVNTGARGFESHRVQIFFHILLYLELYCKTNIKLLKLIKTEFDILDDIQFKKCRCITQI